MLEKKTGAWPEINIVCSCDSWSATPTSHGTVNATEPLLLLSETGIIMLAQLAELTGLLRSKYGKVF